MKSFTSKLGHISNSVSILRFDKFHHALLASQCLPMAALLHVLWPKKQWNLEKRHSPLCCSALQASFMPKYSAVFAQPAVMIASWQLLQQHPVLCIPHCDWLKEPNAQTCQLQRSCRLRLFSSCTHYFSQVRQPTLSAVACPHSQLLVPYAGSCGSLAAASRCGERLLCRRTQT